MRSAKLELGVVIVNYRTGGLVIDCLHSLAAELDRVPDMAVMVVDNASGDDSPDQIENAISDHGWGWATLLRSDSNGGFAAGNNVALRKLLADEPRPRYVLLLNPDTIVRPGAFAALISFMDQHPDVGIAGSRLEHPDGTPQESAFRFHTMGSQLVDGLRLGLVSKALPNKCVAPPVQDHEHQTDWVAGASMIVRPEVFDSVGLMDETYFMYFEEVDFCLAAARADWPCWYVPESRVVHLVGQASGITTHTPEPKRRPDYWFDSRRRYFVKNFGSLYAAITDIIWAAGYATSRLRRWLQRKPDHDPPFLLRDFMRNSVICKGTQT